MSVLVTLVISSKNVLLTIKAGYCNPRPMNAKKALYALSAPPRVNRLKEQVVTKSDCPVDYSGLFTVIVFG